jgi:hypothetical protein
MQGQFQVFMDVMIQSYYISHISLKFSLSIGIVHEDDMMKIFAFKSQKGMQGDGLKVLEKKNIIFCRFVEAF